MKLIRNQRSKNSDCSTVSSCNRNQRKSSEGAPWDLQYFWREPQRHII